MPKIPKEKTAIEVKRLMLPGLHAVGGVPGLQLRVKPTGARAWILRATVGSRRRDIGLGSYPEVGLAEARNRARGMREAIRQGIDPVAERRAERARLITQTARQLTFADAARRCHEAKQPEFRNEKHKKDWISSLECYAFPKIGRLEVADIELAHILQVLEPIWHSKTETATRVRQRLESVLAWATVSGYRYGENPARWLGNLKEVLPNPSKLKARRHYRALSVEKLSAFMAWLREQKGMSARALEFAILTAARSSEVRKATWNEIDWDDETWTVPAERIKAGRRHTVPLSGDALTLLKALKRIEGSNYIFPSTRGGPLSDMSLTSVLRRMNIDVHVHGFRSTFKDWARTRTNYPDEVSELALAHVSNDATRAAYARDELLKKRACMMRDWSQFCRITENAKVVAI